MVQNSPERICCFGLPGDDVVCFHRIEMHIKEHPLLPVVDEPCFLAQVHRSLVPGLHQFIIFRETDHGTV